MQEWRDQVYRLLRERYGKKYADTWYRKPAAAPPPPWKELGVSKAS